MVNVLFVNDNLRLPAGITMVMKNIIDNCNSSDVKFSVLTIQSERNNALKYFQDNGVKVYYMPGTTTTSTNNKLKQLVAKVNILSLFTLKQFFSKFFNEHSFDIVHSHFAQLDRMMFDEAKRNGVKCCISHSHSSQLSDSKIRAIRNKFLCRSLIEYADYCAACSNSAGIALFGDRFIQSSKYMIIKNGIRVRDFAYNDSSRVEIRKQYNINEDTFLIGSVGRLNNVKNQSYMIDVFCKIVKQSEKYKLMLVGCGECEEELREKARLLGLSNNIIFAGVQSNVSAYLSAFDMFIMPSLHEGFGMAAIEAQANGLECIVSSTIPQEVDLTGIKFLDINEAPSVWADAIMSSTKIHHVDYNDIVYNEGYDIQSVCEDLSSFYKNAGK